MRENNEEYSSSMIERDCLVTPEVDAAKSIDDAVSPLLPLNVFDTSNVSHAADAAVIIPDDIAAAVVSPSPSLSVNGSSSNQRNRMRPSAGEQYEIVLTLLSQSLALQSDESATRDAQGELYVLIPHSWWLQWCRYIFHHLEEEEETNDRADANMQRLWDVMPRDYTLPTLRESSPKKAIRRSSSFSSSSSSSSSSAEIVSPPEILDCRSLLPISATQQYLNPDDEEFTHLKPNLVRGHHYELLPREVYSAFLFWYGEKVDEFGLPPMRRINSDGALVLYPEHNEYSNYGRESPTKSTQTQPSPRVVPTLDKEHYNYTCIDADQSHYCAACHSTPASRHKLLQCRQCQSVRYCGTDCQSSHWNYHKNFCRLAAKQKSTTLSSISPPLPFWGRTGLANLGNTCFMNSALQCLSHAYPLTNHFLTNAYQKDINTDNPLGTPNAKLAMSYEFTIKEMWLGHNNNANHQNTTIQRTQQQRGNNSNNLNKSMTTMDRREYSNYISPTHLKRAIAMFASRFAGCNQHDSQEFLAYLLDGLHEDLNRIKDAPYVEMPSVVLSNHGNHLQQHQSQHPPNRTPNYVNLHIAGAKSWDAYRRRNDSLLVDHFHGQYRSTCVCPTCNRISVSFDAFNQVTLEIPRSQQSGNHQQRTRSVHVLFFARMARIVSSDKNNCTNNDSDMYNTNQFSFPVRYAVNVDRDGRLADVRREISALAGVPLSAILFADIYENNIYDLYQDERKLATIHQSDLIAAYEIEHQPNQQQLTTDVASTPRYIHAIATHDSRKMSATEHDDSDEYNDTNELDHPRRKVKHDVLNVKFGFPLLTSFEANISCREVREHLWSQISGFVAQLQPDEGSNDLFGMKASKSEQLSLNAENFCVRVVNQDDEPLPVFQNYCQSLVNNNPNISRLSKWDASYIPHTDDFSLTSVLGLECVDRYLFLSFEWCTDTNVPSKLQLPQTPQYQPGKNTNVASASFPYIDSQKFHSFLDHPSYLESRKAAATSAAEAKKQQKQQSNTYKNLNGVTLGQCFDAFTRPERLDEDNMWYCSNCCNHVRAMKTMELWKLPNVLVLHLKRFDFKSTYRRDKIDTFVDFPLDELNMSKYCSSLQQKQKQQKPFVRDEIPAIYDLFGVTNHYGRMGFGHYTAFARRWNENEIEREWALFDDSSVRTVGDGNSNLNHIDDRIVSPAAYVLFYRRRIFT